MNNISIIISCFALAISALTFWQTRIKNGVLKMTRPTVIFFGPDGGNGKHKKIFIRTLLYSTADKGQYIQNMFIRLQNSGITKNFNVWVYGDKEMMRGSGLFVNKSGIACNHHFLLPKKSDDYSFIAGEYDLEIFIEIVGQTPKKLFSQKLTLTTNDQNELKDKKAGIYFDWVPDEQNYQSHIDIRDSFPKLV